MGWFWWVFGIASASFSWWRLCSKDRKPGEWIIAGWMAIIYTVGLVIAFVFEFIIGFPK